MQLYLSQSLSDQFNEQLESANDAIPPDNNHHWYASSFNIEQFLCVTVRHRVSGYCVVFSDISNADLVNFKQLFVTRILAEIGFIFNLSSHQQTMVEFAMNNYLPLPDFIACHHSESELAIERIKQHMSQRFDMTKQLPQAFEELFDVTIAFNTEINNNGQTAIDSVQQYLSNLLDQIGIDLQLTATQSHSQQQIMPLPQQSEEANVRQSNVVYFPLRKINR